MKYNNVTILVSVCKKYEKVFLKFWEQFSKYSFLEKYNVVIVTDEKIDINIHQFIMNEKWGSRMIYALENISSEYVLFMLDDFIIENVSEKKLEELIAFIFKNQDISNVIFENISSKKNKKFTNNLYLRGRYDKYKTSLQMGIWKKNIFLQLMKKDYSPWEFEIFANFETYVMRGKFLCIEESPINYNKGFYIVQGHINKEEANRLSKQFNIDFFDVDLPIRDEIVRDDIKFINRVFRRLKIEKYRLISIIKSIIERRKNYD